jgi:peptidyl-tRNA hydrolase, PTH1 family
MKILCGLGNPGREYAGHRHNVGFMVLDRLADSMKASWSQTKFEAELATGSLAGEKALLIKPQTFMNLSGASLGGAARFYKVPAADVLVVHDELDLPFGSLQLKSGGGTGGHNGLNSIRAIWGEQGYGRLRFGIGKPIGPNAKERVVGHVLGNFSSEEQTPLSALLTRAVDIVQGWARLGMGPAMNQYNRK